MLNDILWRLWDALKLIILFFTCLVIAQLIFNALISAFLVRIKCPIKSFSFGLLGTSIRRVRLSTASFQIRIGSISFQLGKKLTITINDVDVLFLNDPLRRGTESSKTSANSGGMQSDTLNFTVHKRLIRIINWIFPLYCYLHSLSITLPDGGIHKVELGSIAITKVSHHQIRAEIFMHALSNLKTGDTIHHIAYQFKCGISQKHQPDTKKVEITLKDWSSYFKILGLHIHMHDIMENANRKNLDKSKINSNGISLENYEEILHKSLVRFKAPLKSLKVLDFKVENLILSYKHFVHVKISSAQIYLESVNIFSYGVKLEFLPSNNHTFNDHEISISATSIIVDVNEVSAFRIPLINSIITTDLLSYILEGKSLKRAKIVHNMNVINPSIVATIKQVIEGFRFFNKYNDLVEETAAEHDVAGNNNFSSIVSDGLSLLPSFIFELTISNFSSTLQLSDEENITFKVYNIQALLYRKNKIEGTSSVINFNALEVRPELSFIERDPFTEQLSNYLKVVGTSLVYLKLPQMSEEPVTSIPICGFERSDTFIDDISDSVFNIHSTLRHCSLTLDNLDVLEKVHVAASKIWAEFHTRKDIDASKLNTDRDEQILTKNVNWSLKLRLKDLSCSLLLAGYLPKLLDPAAGQDVNLTNVSRGVILLLNESFLTANPQQKIFNITTASVIRVMDNELQKSVTDTIVTLKDLMVTSRPNGITHFHLPSVRFKVDVNIIWLTYFTRSVYCQYSSLNEKISENAKKTGTGLPNFSFDIDKLIAEMILPQDTPLLLSLSQVQFTNEDRMFKVASISAFVRSVYVKQVPVQVSLMNIRDLQLNVGEYLENKSINIATSLILFHTEYHFRFYMIVDNLISMFKSFKQIKLAFCDLQKFHRLYPSEQHPKRLPSISIFAERFLINVEEDPFEQELGLILKIGVLEQRERLQKLQEFDEQKTKLGDTSDTIEPGNVFSPSRRSFSEDGQLDISFREAAMQTLLENFSTSWIARYRKAKLTFHGMPYHVMKQEILDTEYYLFSAQDTSTVANLVIKDMSLKIGAPSFPVKNYADFIYKYGKGVPKDMVYTLLIIMGIDIQTGLWELRLRDYPLPAISFPDTHTTGDLVFGEKMPEEISLRTVYVPFVPSAAGEAYSKTNSIYGSHIIRTMNSVKTYFNITSSVQSAKPASITWGKSLQPGYTSLMLWFDYLTRPQEDPSLKLGFWDKFRYLAHGKWIYEFSDLSEFHLNIKGSDYPYKIADDGAGLAFCWSAGTTIRIHGTKDPKEFLKIDSKRFQLAVPDFTASNKFDKVLMKLDGRVVWKLGLLFEQGNIHNPGEEKRSAPSRPHYDIELVHPSHVSDTENYDSYSGFRCNYIHMSIGVYSSEKGSSNSLYLAPYSVTHFLKWWNLFHTYTSGPIRQGPLFTDLVQNATKFGRSLFTVKYQLHLEPLVFTHTYRHYTDFGDSSNVSFTGLKGRVHSLRIDLHQKRVKLTHTNEKLKKSKPVWKFKMSTGEIDCTEADIRILSTIFDQADVEEMVASRLGVHYNNGSANVPLSPVDIRQLKESEWYDFEDYVDLDQVSLESSLPLKLDAIPLLSSPRISYFRKINDDGYLVPYPFGDERSHSCMIGKNHPERTQEKLARERGAEIEEEIKKAMKALDDLQEPQVNANINKIASAELNSRLHDLKHRLHIIHTILDDLKLSEEVPSIYSYDDSESSISSDDMSMSPIESYNSNPSLLRTNTIESFRSMRRASTVQTDSTYDNRFIVHNIQFKINKAVRHHLFEYASNSFDRKSMQFFLTYKSVTILKELLNTALTDVKTSINDYGSLTGDDLVSNTEFIERFEELIREVPSDSFDFVDSYLFRLISPQLQFMSDLEPDTAVILAARDIEMGIIDITQVIGKSGKRVAMDVDTIVETRYCAVSKDIQLFTLFKEDVLGSAGHGFHKNGYGIQEGSPLWPPWIPLEMCYDGSLLEKHVFLRRRSMFFTYTAPNPLFFSDKDISGLSNNSKFRVGFPGLIITSTSQQYCSVYNITQDLLSFGSTLDEKVEKLSKVLLADEVRNNLERLDVAVVTNLQRKVKEQYYTREFLKVHDNILYRKTAQELTFEIQATMLELSILMTAIKKNYDRVVSGNKSTQKKLNWHVGTDELIWELYDENKKPFITIGLGPSNFIRSQTSDGSNSNTVALSSLQCFNQQENPVYLELLAPFEENSQYLKDIPMVEIFWRLGPAVGGIADLEDLQVTLQPILFKMDHITSEKIMSYLFPTKERERVVPLSNEVASKQPSISAVLTSQGIRRSGSRSSLSSGRSSSDGRDVESWDLTSIQSSGDGSSIKKRAPKKITTSILNQPDENINEMVKRSGMYFNVRSVLIKKTTMSVCYKGAHHVLTDVDNLIVKVPNLKYRHKLWSRDELFAALKRDITKVVLQHLGNIIGNKLVPHKKENKLKASMDISQLLKWESVHHSAAPSLSSHKIKSAHSLVSSNGIQKAQPPTEEEYDVKPFFPETNN